MTPTVYFQKKSFFYIIFTLFLTSSFACKAVQQDELAQMQQAMQQNPAILFIAEFYELCPMVEQAIQLIAIQIKQNNIKGIKNHLKANKALLEHQKGITQAMMSDQILLQVDPVQQAEIITSYAHILSDLIDHIRWLLHKKFDFKTKSDVEKAQFDILKSMQRASKIPLTSLPDILKALRSKVEQFKQEADEIALTRVNKIARKINSKFVDRWTRYHGTTITKYTLFGGIFISALAYKGAALTLNSKGTQYLDQANNPLLNNREHDNHSDESQWSIHKKHLKLIQDNDTLDTSNIIIVNDKTHQARYNMMHLYDFENKKFRNEFLQTCNPIEEKSLKILEILGLPGSLRDSGWFIPSESIGMLGTIDQMVTATLSNAWPLISLLGNHGYSTGKEKWNSSLYPFLSQHMEHLWNQMLGGAHKDVSVGHTFNVIPDVTLDDIIGMDEVKDLFKHIIDFVMNPEPYHASNSAPPTNLLLSGPTRTGKTFIVEGLAGSLSQKFKKVGKTDNEVRYWPIPGILVKEFGIQNILRQAREVAPVVLFIDEVDLLNLQRGANDNLLGDFLTGMGNNLSQDPSKPVILIVATNRPETLDPALVTPGRLGKEIRFEYPPFRFRKDFLVREFEKMALDVRQFDIDSLAAKTDSLSFEDLRAILRGGMIRAWSRKTPLTQMILEESLDTEIRGIITANRKELPEHEKQIIASHFAGQALAYHLFDTGKMLDKVTLKAIQTELEVKNIRDTFSNQDIQGKDGKKIVFGQLYTSSIGDSANLSDFEQVVNQIKVLVAGFIAEELIVGSCGRTCHPEFDTKALDLAISLFLDEKESKQRLSKGKREELLDKAFALYEQCKQEVRVALENNLELLSIIVEEMKKKEGSTGSEIQIIIDEYKTPSEPTSQEVVSEEPDTKETPFKQTGQEDDEINIKEEEMVTA